MAFADVTLKRHAYPIDDSDACGTSIREDHAFCPVCCNLSPGSASSLLPREDIQMHANSGVENALVAREKGPSDGKHVVPAWAGISRCDYASWQISAALEDVIDASGSGCPSCSLLFAGLVYSADGSFAFDDPLIKLNIMFCVGDVLRVWLYRDHFDDEEEIGIFGDLNLGAEVREHEDLLSVEFYTLEGHPSPWPTIGSSMKLEQPTEDGIAWPGKSTRHILARPDATSVAKLLEPWIQDCRLKHDFCKKIQDDRLTHDFCKTSLELPTRVIYVGGEDNKNIHLFQPQEDQKSGHEYVALSHCWGLSQHLISTKSTIENWKQNIPWAKLPRTFQDAIALTRCLGIHYIWIDSLCIVQDDKGDWESEAAKMGTVYNDATFVIAATASVDGDGGLFLPKLSHSTIRGIDQHQNTFEVFVKRTIPHTAFTWGSTAISHSGTRHGMTDPVGYPLFARAWCFQERVLGRRILHFTQHEIVFECLTSLQCECGSLSDYTGDWLLPFRRLTSAFSVDTEHIKSRPPYLGNHPPVTDKDFIIGELPELVVKRYDSDEMSRFLVWQDLVSEYSRKSITRYSDWLPALGGLASRWFSLKTGPYLAGLWPNDLLRSLLWIAVGSDREEKLSYIAPTWSWASVQRAVRWPTKGNISSTYFIQVDLTKSQVVTLGLAVYGQLKDGWILLKGCIAEVELARIRSDSFSEPRAYLNIDGIAQEVRVDDIQRCASHVGSKVLWLKYCNDGGHERAIILATAPEEAVQRLPQEIQSSPIICQRLGVVEYVNKDIELPNMRLESMYII